MPRHLPVPFYPQSKPGYCLAACAQMVLAYYGYLLAQEQLARVLGVQPYLGAPAKNIRRLATDSRNVVVETGDLSTVQNWLSDRVPVIAFIQAGELSHWRGEQFQHAVVVVGLDEETIWLLDPDAGQDPMQVNLDEFLLAWGEMDYLYTVISS